MAKAIVARKSKGKSTPKKYSPKKASKSSSVAEEAKAALAKVKKMAKAEDANDDNFRFKKGDIVYVFKHYNPDRQAIVPKKYIVGKGASQQVWSKTEILEPWYKEEKGFENYKVKQIDGYSQKFTKDGEVSIVSQDQMSTQNKEPIPLGYVDKIKKLEKGEPYAQGGEVAEEECQYIVLDETGAYTKATEGSFKEKYDAGHKVKDKHGKIHDKGELEYEEVDAVIDDKGKVVAEKEYGYAKGGEIGNFSEYEKLNEKIKGTKVADKQGDSKIVYHGTVAAYHYDKENPINKTKDLFGKGFYFTEDLERTSLHPFDEVTMKGQMTQPSREVFYALVDLKNPLIIEDKFGYMRAVDETKEKLSIDLDDDNEVLAKAGYDGVMAMYDGKLYEIVVFNQDQIHVLGIFDRYGKDLKESEYKLGGKIHQNPPEGQNYSEEADRARNAKPVGWRFTNEGAERLGISKDKRPTAAQVEQYKGKEFKRKGKVCRWIYEEARADKSDFSRKEKFENGGQLDDIKTGDIVVVETDYGPHEGRVTGPHHMHDHLVYVEGLGDPVEKDRLRKLEEGGKIETTPEYFGTGENLNVFGYQTKFFINCPTATDEFNKAMDFIEERFKENDAWYNQASGALKNMAEEVDSILADEHDVIENGVSVTESMISGIVWSLHKTGIFNCKSGLKVAIQFLGKHVFNIASRIPKAQVEVIEPIVEEIPEPIVEPEVIDITDEDLKKLGDQLEADKKERGGRIDNKLKEIEEKLKNRSKKNPKKIK